MVTNQTNFIITEYNTTTAFLTHHLSEWRAVCGGVAMLSAPQWHLDSNLRPLPNHQATAAPDRQLSIKTKILGLL